MVAWACIGLLAGLGVPACGDEALPEKDEDPGGGHTEVEGCPSQEQCVEVAAVRVGLDATSALGFSAAEVLALAAGEHQATLLWELGSQHAERVRLGFMPELGPGQITVDVAYDGGEVRHVTSESQGGCGFIRCNDHLEIDVEVSVRSAGGALNERFAATLRATTPHVVTLSGVVPQTGLAGALMLAVEDPPNAELGVGFDLMVTAVGIFGTVAAVVTLDEYDAPLRISLGRWPAGEAPCLAEFAPVPLEAAVAAFSARDVLALFAAVGELPLRWDDASETTLALDVQTVGATACAAYSGFSELSLGRLYFPATVTARTGDGRWDGAFPVSIDARPDRDEADGGVLNSVMLYADLDAQAEALAASLGLLEVHSGWFDATYWPPHTAPLTRGRLVLSGVDDAEKPVELEAAWGNL